MSHLTHWSRWSPKEAGGWRAERETPAGVVRALLTAQPQPGPRAPPGTRKPAHGPAQLLLEGPATLTVLSALWLPPCSQQATWRTWRWPLPAGEFYTAVFDLCT